MAFDNKGFSSFAKKKFGGGGGFGGGGFKKKSFQWNEGYNKFPRAGGGEEPEEEEGGIMGLLGGQGKDPEGAKGQKPEGQESESEEGSEEETIEKVLDLFDQLTPLIEKLRDLKK